MIIKCLFRRYERWNPVHPTVGAFWGMGFGIGCGVGWGPGFGPEVIGYVGSGCGLGFSVGFTMAGIGIGLPANYFFQLPYNAVMATKSAVEYGRASGFLSMESIIPTGSWTLVAPRVSIFRAEAGRRLSKFKQHNFLKPRANLFVPLQSESAWKSLQTFSVRIFQPRNGPGD